MELRQLEHYVAVAAEMNFSRAAERTHVTQAALSASIAKLETELGTVLIDRSRRPIILTPAGRAFLYRAQEAIDAARRAKDSVDQFRGQMTGEVSIGTMMTCGSLDLPGALADFRRAHPLVKIRLVQNREGSTDNLKLLADGRLDLALVSWSPPEHDVVVVEELASEEMVLVSHPTHELAADNPVELTNLADHEIVHFPRGWGIRDRLEASLGHVGVDLMIPYEVAYYELAAELVRNRLGVTVLPVSAARRFPDLVATALQPPVTWTISIAYAAPARNRPVISTLIDTLHHHLT